MGICKRAAFLQLGNQFIFMNFILIFTLPFFTHFFETLKVFSLKSLICFSSINNIFNQTFQRRAFPIISRYKVFNSIFPKHFKNFSLILRLKIVYADGMTTIAIHQLHTRNICITVTDINHISKWNNKFVRLKIIIYFLVIYIQNPFLYSKQILRFIRIINRLRRPNRDPVIIEIKRTGIYFLKILRYLRSFYHFLQSGRDNIMLNGNPLFLSILIYTLKPSIDARIQFNFSAILF